MVSSLFVLGLVILVGFIGHVLYKKTKVPESIFLILLGVLFGPVLGIIDGQFFLENASFFLNLALVVVLLNSGMTIDIFKTLKNTPLAFLFTFLVLIITAGIVTSVTHFFFGWPIINGIILGVLGFGTELITISDILDKLKIGQNTKTLLILESVINDIILIVIITILMTFVTHNEGVSIIQLAVDMILISTFIGLVFAVAWIYLFARYIHGNALEYIFTLGAAFFIFDVIESLGFNGAITVLVFSLTLGNYRHFLKMVKNSKDFVTVEKDIVMVEGVNNQITFLVRTLFFFFIGLIFNITVVSPGVLFFAVMITLVLLAARFFAGDVLSLIDQRFKKSVPLLTIMAASGFVDTLLAVMVARAGVDIPNLTEIILLIVVFTTVSSLIGMIVLQKYYSTQQTY